MKYKFRRISPKQREEIRNLRKKGYKQKEIAVKFGVSDNTIRYHLLTNKKRKNKVEYAKRWNKKFRKPNQKIKYITEYMKKRYQEDEEFRRKMIKYVMKSSKKRRNNFMKKGVCIKCGRKRDSKFLMCSKCRKYNREKKKIIQLSGKPKFVN